MAPSSETLPPAKMSLRKAEVVDLAWEPCKEKMKRKKTKMMMKRKWQLQRADLLLPIRASVTLSEEIAKEQSLYEDLMEN